MIINKPATCTVVRIVQELDNSAFHFHLTGSRFFGNHRLNSDYDFFIGEKAMSNGLVGYLESLGFFIHLTSEYFRTGYGLDDQVVCVYRWQDGTDNIDIQVVKDVTVKAEAQDLLKNFPIPGLLGHSSPDRRAIWNWAYTVVGG